MLAIDVLYKRKWSDFDWTPWNHMKMNNSVIFNTNYYYNNDNYIDNDNAITLKMASDIDVNPLPLIVISRNFSGNWPAISLRKSVAATLSYDTFGPDMIFCGSGALMHNFCKFNSCETIFGILKSGKSKYVDNFIDRNDDDLPNAPFYCKWNLETKTIH